MADKESRKVDKDAPLSVDTIYQLINSSIQSQTPLYLPNANMSGAFLVQAQLPGANLADANLSRADLQFASLNGAGLQFANLTGAALQRADLTGAGLGGANLSGAIYNANTQWPADFDPKAAGAVLRE